MILILDTQYLQNPLLVFRLSDYVVASVISVDVDLLDDIPKEHIVIGKKLDLLNLVQVHLLHFEELIRLDRNRFPEVRIQRECALLKDLELPPDQLDLLPDYQLELVFVFIRAFVDLLAQLRDQGHRLLLVGDDQVDFKHLDEVLVELEDGVLVGDDLVEVVFYFLILGLNLFNERLNGFKRLPKWYRSINKRLVLEGINHLYQREVLRDTRDALIIANGLA